MKTNLLMAVGYMAAAYAWKSNEIEPTGLKSVVTVLLVVLSVYRFRQAMVKEV